MKRIWFISKYGTTPEQNGAQRQFSLSKEFSKLNYETTLIISRSNSCNPNPPLKKYYSRKKFYDLKVIILNGPKINLGISGKRILSWLIFEFNLLRFSNNIKKEQIPNIIIISSLSFLTIITGIILKKKYNCKLIIEIRDIWPLTLIHIGKFNKKNIIIRILERIEKWGYKNADGIVGTMPRLDIHVKKVLKKSFNFKCVPMGFSEIQLEKATTWKEEEQGSSGIKLPKNKFIVAYAGAIGKANLVHEIVETAKILQNQSEIFFAIFGDGPLKPQLELLSKNYGNICFYGKIPKYMVPFALKKCNVLLSPIDNNPIYDYGVSFNKWIDYMLSGKPIIVSYSGYKSIINEANCGIFIEANNPGKLADKIIEFKNLKTKALNDMGKRGYEYALQYHNYKSLGKEYIDFINSI